jgi:hypothetical protein
MKAYEAYLQQSKVCFSEPVSHEEIVGLKLMIIGLREKGTLTTRAPFP